MKYKLKNFFSFFKFSVLKDTIKKMGYDITISNLLSIVGVIGFGVFIVGFLLHLNIEYILILGLFFILMLPSMIITKFKVDYESVRFTSAVDYMEQLIYSFHKSNKIREALVDVYSVSHGAIKTNCKRMIDCIDYDTSTSKIYEKALSIMQKDFDCTRMKLLHDYLIEVEYNGGESARSLNILLTDIRNWSLRVLEYQQERKNVKSKVVISIMLALLSCGLMINLIPDDYLGQIIVAPMYQIGTTAILALCIVVYVVASSLLSKSYLDNELDRTRSRRVKSDAEFIAKYNSKNHAKPALIKVILMTPIILALVHFKIYVGILPVAILALFFIFKDFLRKRGAVANITKEINILAPVWIRTIVLYLQTENVHVAIQKSYDSSPDLLKPELKVLIRGISKDPGSSKPYMNFLKDFNTPNLKLSVNYLFAISQFGSEDMLAQLDYLIEQSSLLSINEEKIRNEDSIASFSLICLAPMLLAVLKLLLDMALFLNIIMSTLSTYGGF